MNLQPIEALLSAAYRPEEHPALSEQRRRWRSEKPLAGLSVIDATPVFRNTLAKHLALVDGGASLTVGISDLVPRDPAAVRILESCGIPVARPGDAGLSADLVIDCGASFIGTEPAIGYVELTRSGTDHYRGAAKPAYIADSGLIKRIETSLGTGESYFRAMEKLGYGDWKGRNIVIFGSGKVGTGLLIYARKKGAVPYVVTVPGTASAAVKSLAEEVLDTNDTDAVAACIGEASCAVAATGAAGALAAHAGALGKSRALIANMGLEDEFGPELPAGRVLLGKRPLNFMLEEPTQMKYIDATMALHNEGAAWLAANRGARGLVLPPHETEEAILETTRRHGLIADELHLILQD